jgi:RND family efflux transporter MFP subunit
MIAAWGRRALPVALTLATVAVAAVLCHAMWHRYVDAPWTRDGTVRAYVVTVAPEVAGRVVELPVADNEYVHKGQLLMVVEPTDYRIAVARSAAALAQARLDAMNLVLESQRRARLARLDAVAQEQAQNYDINARVAQARVVQAEAVLRQARVNLERTRIRSPVNGWVTNLTVRRDDFVTVGRSEVSVVDADSFWVDAYFEETKLASICEGEEARMQLMGYPESLDGSVDSVARGITVANAQPNQEGLANVNPIYTWVRLAQRVPVRIRIDKVPDGVRLVAGMTATVQVLASSSQGCRERASRDRLSGVSAHDRGARRPELPRSAERTPARNDSDRRSRSAARSDSVFPATAG